MPTRTLPGPDAGPRQGTKHEDLGQPRGKSWGPLINRGVVKDGILFLDKSSVSSHFSFDFTLTITPVFSSQLTTNLRFVFTSCGFNKSWSL